MKTMTREIDVSYYLVQEMIYVLEFLKKRFSINNKIYLDFTNGRDDYLPRHLDRIEIDEKRLDSEIRFVESILRSYPYMDFVSETYLPDLYKLKKQYQSLRKKAIKALEDKKKEEEES